MPEVPVVVLAAAVTAAVTAAVEVLEPTVAGTEITKNN
jgi:hypothetical protein